MMQYKKTGYVVLAMVCLAGCTAVPSRIIPVQNTAPAAVAETMTACLRREALLQIQSGSAFATSVRTTAQKVVAACQKTEAGAGNTADQVGLLQQAIQVINELLAVQ